MGWVQRMPGVRAVPAAVLLLVATATSGCASGSGTPDGEQLSPPSAPVGMAVDVAGAELWLSFDDTGVSFDGEPAYADAQGGASVGQVATANGGEAQVVDGAPGRGSALAFPERCTSATGCPRALVEVAVDTALEPGDQPFAFGASVLLARDQTAVGSNIVQSGRFGSDGGQWKLQVDGEEGQPSCIIRSGDVLARVRSSLTIADDAWHRVVCRRDEKGISIEVDGDVQRRAATLGAIDTGLPIRIGSPGVGDADDQFHGTIDDVVVDIDPEE